MKTSDFLWRALAGGSLALIAACAAAPQQNAGTAAAASANGPQPLIYLASRWPSGSLEQCLLARVPQAHVSHAELTTLFVGPDSNDEDWVVTLQASGSSTVLSVYPPQRGSGTPEEPELRFDIARCAV
jgi:hypothetical protein